MPIIYKCLYVLAAYLIGSLSFAVIISKVFFHTDVRKAGSHSAGASNVLRQFGWGAALAVVILDMLKGVAAVSLVFLTNYRHETDPFVGYQIGLGMAAVLGHIFPIFFGFRGGKGVATLMGVVWAIHPFAALICFALFLSTVLITKYISVGSIVAAISFPLFVNLLFAKWIQPEETLTLKIFSLVVAVLVVCTHARNIQRLLSHTEPKIKKKGKTAKTHSQETDAIL